jgi:hypothetical protein
LKIITNSDNCLKLVHKKKRIKKNLLEEHGRDYPNNPSCSIRELNLSIRIKKVGKLVPELLNLASNQDHLKKKNRRKNKS